MTPAQFHRLALELDTRQKTMRHERERVCQALHGLADLLELVDRAEPRYRPVISRLERMLPP